jgi:DNA-binding IclR family transcriptional regulator
MGKNQKRQMRLTEICHEIGIHKSKGYSILNTLKQYGLVVKDPRAKTYALGPGLLFLSRRVLDTMDIPDLVGADLEGLASETGSTALFGLINESQVFIVAKHEGGRDIGITIRLGHRFPLTAGAHGKAITAFLPDEERKRVLSRKRLYFYGDPSRMDRTRLIQELEMCRDRGFAEDEGELQPGIWAAAAPVFGIDRKVMGCVILIGTFGPGLVRQHGQKVAETGRRLSRKIGGGMPRE